MAWKAGKSTTLNMASVDFWGVNGIFPSRRKFRSLTSDNMDS